MNQSKKILLLSDFPPSENLTGGIAVNHLCSFIADENLAIFTVLNPILHPKIPERYNNVVQKKVEKPFEGWGHRDYGIIRSLIMESKFAIIDLPQIARRVVKFAKDWGAEAIWVILEGQMMIRLAKLVSDRVDIPMYPQVFDPPDWWFREWKVNPIHTYLFLLTYDEVIRKGAKVAVASWAMADAYRQKRKVEAIPVVPPLPKSIAIPPNLGTKRNTRNTLRLGIAGQLYARHEWEALLNALDSVAWEIRKKKVSIKLIGNHDPKNFDNTNIEVLGWKPQEETISILSKLDVLYCPYWFNSIFEKEARFCFPSKLTSYLAAGRPVLVHSPKYASPAIFVEKYQTGVVCSSLDEDQIINSICAIIEDDATYNKFAQNGFDAYLEKLTMESVKEQFSQFLPLSN